MSIQKIIERARRMKRIRDGLVLCDNCDNPADGKISPSIGWTACGPCAWGESDALEPDNFIYVAGTP
jgi:hypothetical protein